MVLHMSGPAGFVSRHVRRHGLHHPRHVDARHRAYEPLGEFVVHGVDGGRLDANHHLPILHLGEWHVALERDAFARANRSVHR